VEANNEEDWVEGCTTTGIDEIEAYTAGERAARYEKSSSLSEWGTNK